jgi:hypothetical protein
VPLWPTIDATNASADVLDNPLCAYGLVSSLPRDALMLFVCTFDMIFELAPIVRELFGYLVDPA